MNGDVAFCPRCGSRALPEDLFCGACGQRLASEPAAAPAAQKRRRRWPVALGIGVLLSALTAWSIYEVVRPDPRELALRFTEGAEVRYSLNLQMLGGSGGRLEAELPLHVFEVAADGTARMGIEPEEVSYEQADTQDPAAHGIPDELTIARDGRLLEGRAVFGGSMLGPFAIGQFFPVLPESGKVEPGDSWFRVFEQRVEAGEGLFDGVVRYRAASRVLRFDQGMDESHLAMVQTDLIQEFEIAQEFRKVVQLADPTSPLLAALADSPEAIRVLRGRGTLRLNALVDVDAGLVLRVEGTGRTEGVTRFEGFPPDVPAPEPGVSGSSYRLELELLSEGG